MQNSGKLLILGILSVALLLAGASWWFRYNATHQAAQFWGPEASQLIRDAPHVSYVQVELQRTENGDVLNEVLRRDVSAAPGITHLRNALLEDQSFEWPVPESPPGVPWTNFLEFRGNANDGPAYTIFFSPDFGWAFGGSARDSTDLAVSCRPIAKGLAEMFAEFAAEAPPTR